MSPLHWYEHPGGWWEAFAVARDWRGEGFYYLTMEARPGHCDRGRWIVKVSSVGAVCGLDEQEGFPRYYFDRDRARLELDAWCQLRTCLVRACTPEETRRHSAALTSLGE